VVCLRTLLWRGPPRKWPMLASILFASGCYCVKVSPPATVGPAVKHGATADGSVSATADPLVKSERQQDAFHQALGEHGVIPIYVSLENNGRDSVALHQQMVILRADGDGAVAASLPVDAARAVYGFEVKPPTPERQCPSPEKREEIRKDLAAHPWRVPLAIIGGIAFHPISLPLIGVTSFLRLFDPTLFDDRATAGEAYADAALKTGPVAKGKSSRGFVYFISPSMPNAVLEIRLTDDGGLWSEPPGPVVETLTIPLVLQAPTETTAAQ
jgi:hypothetical protein